MSTRTKVFTAFGLATVLALAPVQVSLAGPSCPGQSTHILACPAPTTTAPSTTIPPTTAAPTTVAATEAPTTEAATTSVLASIAPPTVEATIAVPTTAPPTEATVESVRASRSALPSTGTSPVTVLAVSGLLLAVGVAIAVATRRRATS